ncbi:hypothetical protein [Planosporangium flavigriseum]|uniref:Uncharacterized protein n=1 Tax=Planosporangium flavigriseum TaxID=373681 RepID=A0A8J3LU16_9ACTN|nr:hypothetical protein [Planosporangium flavigriseum]GIG76760.1 hypothetical protein Pfl04_51640 [Planosporangium flavigriseum]
MTTIEIDTTERDSRVSTDHMSLVAVCLFALMGLAGIITMTV